MYAIGVKVFDTIYQLQVDMSLTISESTSNHFICHPYREIVLFACVKHLHRQCVALFGRFFYNIFLPAFNYLSKWVLLSLPISITMELYSCFSLPLALMFLYMCRS